MHSKFLAEVITYVMFALGEVAIFEPFLLLQVTMTYIPIGNPNNKTHWINKLNFDSFITLVCH